MAMDVRASARQSLPQVWTFSLASVPIAMIMLMLGTYLPRFYAGHVGVDLAALGLTIAAIRLVDVGADLLLGWLMDRTDTPLGRFRPWLMLSAPVVAYAVYRLFDPPPDADLCRPATGRARSSRSTRPQPSWWSGRAAPARP